MKLTVNTTTARIELEKSPVECPGIGETVPIDHEIGSRLLQVMDDLDHLLGLAEFGGIPLTLKIEKQNGNYVFTEAPRN